MSIANPLPSNFHLRRNKSERYYFENFSREEVDKFYDLMEICYDCVFIDRINPKTNLPYLSTGEPYKGDPIISDTTYVPYLLNGEMNISPLPKLGNSPRYEFIVKSLQDPCPFIHIHLQHSEASVEVVYHPFTAHGINQQEWHLVNFCFSFDSSLDNPEYVNDLFKIWMNIPKFRLRKADIYQQYSRNKRLYIDGMQNIADFKLRMQVFSMGYHENLGPRNWVGSMMGVADLTELIGQREVEDMKERLMVSVLR